MIAKVERTYFNDVISGAGVVMPNSVNTICPFCKRNVHIQMTWKYQLNQEDNYCSVQCPNCKKKLRFIYLVDPNDAKNLDAGQLYMDPGFQERRLLEGIEENDKLPTSLKRAYLSAVTVYNAREWTSTAVMCRRVLEGIVKTINPSVKPNANLARSLENLRTTMDFNKPIMTIADEICGTEKCNIYYKVNDDGVKWEPGFGKSVPGNGGPFVLSLDNGQLILTSNTGEFLISDDYGKNWYYTISPWKYKVRFSVDWGQTVWPSIYQFGHDLIVAITSVKRAGGGHNIKCSMVGC